MGAGASSRSSSLERIQRGARTRTQWMRLLGRAAIRVDDAFSATEATSLTWAEITGEAPP